MVASRRRVNRVWRAYLPPTEPRSRSVTLNCYISGPEISRSPTIDGVPDGFSITPRRAPRDAHSCDGTGDKSTTERNLIVQLYTRFSNQLRPFRNLVVNDGGEFRG